MKPRSKLPEHEERPSSAATDGDGLSRSAHLEFPFYGPDQNPQDAVARGNFAHHNGPLPQTLDATRPTAVRGAHRRRTETPLDLKSGVEVGAHPVIGWDEGRTSVTDMGSDYLRVLGYAVRDPDSGVIALYERRDGALHCDSA
jgi:hypothetical protein